MKKKAMVSVTNAWYLSNSDEWDSFRAEGRIPLNMGFGLSLLGYDVNIVCPVWNLDEPKKTWNDIQLSKFPIHKHYDLGLTFSIFNSLYGIEFDTVLSIVYDDAHISRTIEFSNNVKDVKYTCNHKESLDAIKQIVNKKGGNKNKVFYVPPLFPISSLNAGFVQCKYNNDLKSSELKLFLYYTGWSQNTTISGDRFVNKEQLIINHLKSKGYKIKLSILVESRTSPCPIKNNKDDQSDIEFHYSCECNYADIIKLIQSSDMCITYGAPVFTGSSVTDMISLGKPVIYIGDGRLGNEWPFDNLNHLYECPNDIIYIQEDNLESMIKLNKMIDDPINSWKRYANTLKDYDFNNWKHFMVNAING